MSILTALLKPPGSPGRLETLAVQLGGMPGLQGGLHFARKTIVVMCADHGVWHEGVTVSPQTVTAIRAANMTRKNTGVCVLAAQAGADVQVVDIGIDAEPIHGLVNMKVARGSGNIACTAAMSREQAEALLLASMRYTRQLADRGVRLFGVGELGMANTTPAAAVVSVLTGHDAGDVVGIGANLPVSQLAHKAEVVRRAIAVNQPSAGDGLDVLAKVGGFDLLGMAGVMLGAASCGLPVILDGFFIVRFSTGGLPDRATVASVPDSVASVGGEGGTYCAGTPAVATLSGDGHALRRGQRRGVSHASGRGGRGNVQQYGDAG